jgi:hypothetical protein
MMMPFQLLKQIDNLLVTVSQTLNMELTVDQLVRHFTDAKRDVEREYNRLDDHGLQLLERLRQPILVNDGFVD